MKKFIVAVCAVFACFVAVSAPKQKAVVYVDDFVPISGANCKIMDSELQVLKDRIIGNVVSSRKYDVVERENLSKVQKELKLVDAGLTEGDAPESNNLKAAGYTIYGKVLQFRNYVNKAQIGDVEMTELKGTIEVQIRIVNIETTRQLAAKTIKKEVAKRTSNVISSSKNLELEVMTEAIDLVAKEVVLKLNEIAFPVYVTDADGKYITANISAEQVTVGEVWKIWRRRGKKFDPETNEQDGYREKEMGCAIVKYPGPKETKFELQDKEDASEIEDYIDSMDGRINVDKALILRKIDVIEEAPAKKKISPPKRSLREML